MTRRIIVESGPLVAFLDRWEAHHAWIAEQAKTLPHRRKKCELGRAAIRVSRFALSFPMHRDGP